MKYLFLATLILGLSSTSNALSDADFDKVKWTYEIFEDDTGPELFEVSIDKQSPSGKPHTSESLKIPLKNVECAVHPPMIHGESLVVSRALSCKEKGNKSFSQSIWVGCGPSKKSDVATNHVHGIYCETEKKCYQKEYKIIYSCSI
jgi:hypothetical protein